MHSHQQTEEKQEYQQQYLPNLNRKYPINSLMELIRTKKAEYSKQLETYHQNNESLPAINYANNFNEAQEESLHYLSEKEVQERQESSNKKRNSQYLSVKYKSMLDKTLAEKSSNQKYPQLQSFNQRRTINSTKNHRTKTENHHFQRKKITNNTKHISVHRAVQDTIAENHKEQKMEELYIIFCTAISKVPKNMKMRNQENLQETLSALEGFNPFFNRNQRIVNICLLKMGKIVLKDSPFQLYKAGQQLDYFYIILHGRVKVSEGGCKRICVTGQTILEQTIFTPNIRKISLQNAKVLGVCYLLEMKIDQYRKMKEQLTKYGLKQSFNETESIIKRNYITKNWMRNKKRIEGNK